MDVQVGRGIGFIDCTDSAEGGDPSDVVRALAGPWKVVAEKDDGMVIGLNMWHKETGFMPDSACLDEPVLDVEAVSGVMLLFGQPLEKEVDPDVLLERLDGPALVKLSAAVLGMAVDDGEYRVYAVWQPTDKRAVRTAIALKMVRRD